MDSRIIGLGILLLLAGCDQNVQRPKTEEKDPFYTYTGYRDWWRFPLEYPYQMLMIDTFRAGYLEQYNPAYPVEDPNQSSTALLQDITLIAREKEFAALQTASEGLALLVYRTGELTEFNSEEELLSYLREHCQFAASLRWQDMDTCYREFEKSL